MEQIRLHFFGPYNFVKSDKSLFHSPYVKSEGIYLWVIKDIERNHNYIEYVGEATNFAKRQKEHIMGILSLNYRILDAESATKGILKIIWNGMWRDKTENAVGNTIENYGLISPQVTGYIKTISVFFAPTKLTTDMRRHIEGCIALNLRKKYPDLAIFFPDDNRMRTKPKMLGEKVMITADEEILGLDNEIII